MIKSKLKQIALLIGDVAILYASLFLALGLRYLAVPTDETWYLNSSSFIGVFIIWILVFYINSLYDLKIFARKNLFLESFFKSLLSAFVLSIFYFYLLPVKEISPKTNLVIFSFVVMIMFLAWRYSFLSFIKHRLPKNNIGIIGQNQKIEELIKIIKDNPHLGYEIKFMLDPETEENLEELISKDKITTLILEKDMNASPELQKKLFNCLPLGLAYITLANFYEKITGRVPLEIITESWFLENLHFRDKKIYEFAKRIIDIIAAIIGLIISLPFWPIIALFIKLGTKGPIFFKQIRLGKNNIPFTMIKFRTMVIENNDYSLTTKGDKRITKSGQFLRKTRIDEIPQLINILKGDMSFVGPRPERPEFVSGLEKDIPFYDIRTLVKPGVTGWDQISGEYHSASTLDTIKKLQHDLYYIKNRGILLDITIILKTVRAVLAYKGR